MWSCTQQTSGEEVKTSVTQKEKSKGICMEEYPEKYHFLLFLHIHNQSTTTTAKFSLHRVSFQKISEGYRRLPKTAERFPKTNEEVRPLPKMSEEPLKNLPISQQMSCTITSLLSNLHVLCFCIDGHNCVVLFRCLFQTKIVLRLSCRHKCDFSAYIYKVMFFLSTLPYM